MNQLREATVNDLYIAEFVLKGERNVSLILGVVITIVLLIAGWTFWFYFVPSFFFCRAWRRQFSITLAQGELERRRLANTTSSPPAVAESTLESSSHDAVHPAIRRES